MSPYDSDNATASGRTDTELADAYEGADRLAERYWFPLKLGALYAVVVALGYGIHLVASSQFVNTIAALMVYFTLLVAVGSAVIGGLFALIAAVRTE